MVLGIQVLRKVVTFPAWAAGEIKVTRMLAAAGWCSAPTRDPILRGVGARERGGGWTCDPGAATLGGTFAGLWTPDALLDACSNGELERVKGLLLLGGANIEQRGRFGCTALHLATDNVHRAVHADVVEYLLDRGADVSAIDTLGNTPLHKAAVFGAALVVKSMLDHGAHVNAVNDLQTTPLHKAVMSGDREVMEVLLSHGANIHIPDKGKCTPLHKAVAVNNVAAVGSLLSAGADPNALDSLGNTPWDKANFCEHTTIKLLLKKRGGRSGRPDVKLTPSLRSKTSSPTGTPASPASPTSEEKPPWVGILKYPDLYSPCSVSPN